MMTSYFNLLKYAATGIASPDMSYYDKMRASMLMSGVVQTLTGIPPLSFKADGTPLISWSMLGNGSQSGTPTPDNPVMPEFVGVRTANLFDKDNQACYFPNTSLGQGNQWKVIGSGVVLRIPCEPSTAYTISLRGEYTQNVWNVELTSSDDIPTAENPVSTNAITSTKPSNLTTSLTTLSNTKYILLQLSVAYINSGGNANIMINSGSTALPYEPFGYKIPITCGGETTPVYLGQTQTVRRIKKYVFKGTENLGSNGLAQSKVGFTFEKSDMKTGQRRNGFCSHFEPQHSPVGSAKDGITFGGDDKVIYVTFSVSSASALNLTNVASIKTWLAAQYANGTPVTVWYILSTEQTGIVNEPLAKISEYADELHSEDAGVTIPVVRGQNTLTVDTTIQPSEMTITYRG